LREVLTSLVVAWSLLFPSVQNFFVSFCELAACGGWNQRVTGFPIALLVFEGMRLLFYRVNSMPTNCQSDAGWL
jgi:hypothetical protein